MSFMIFTFFLALFTFLYKFYIKKSNNIENWDALSIEKEKNSHDDLKKEENIENKQIEKNIKSESVNFEKESLKVEEPIHIIKKKEPLNTVLSNKTEIILDLNTSKKEDLLKIKGIGEKISDRIIKFRDKLGGFVSLNQLDSIYGIDKKNIENIKKKLKILENFKPKTIKINELSFKEILAHPYISYESTKKICNHKKNSKIQNLNELKSLLTEDDCKNFNYLKNYVEF